MIALHEAPIPTTIPTYGPRRARRAWLKHWDALPFLLLALLLLLILRAPGQINHDCAYVLECAQLLVMGQLPYVGFIDVNPPLIFYLNVVPVWASRVTGLALPLSFSLFVLAQLALSSGAVFFLLRRRELNLKPAARFALLAAWLLSSVFVYTTGDFGQRDHLVILVVFPFTLLRIIRVYEEKSERSTSRGVALALGLATGIGLCLKPNFFFLVCLPEAVALVHARRARWLQRPAPELVACGAFCVLYALHFLFLPELVRAELFGRWLPFFARYYGTINVNLLEHMFSQPLVIAGAIGLAAVIVLAFFIVHRRGMSSLRIEMLSALTAGGVLSYWVQQKGYSYHALPAKLSLVMLVMFASLWFYEEIVHRRERLIFRRALAASPAVVMLALLAVVSIHSYFSARAYVRYDAFRIYREAILRQTRAEDRVLFINTTLFPAFPTLVQTGRLPASRYLTSFPLAGFYYGVPSSPLHAFAYRTKEAMPEEEQKFLTELALDIRVNHPAIIFIHSGARCSAMPEGFNMDEYFHKAGFIGEAMRGYAPAGRVGDFSVYLQQTPPPQEIATLNRTRGRL